jgi:DNA-binding NarL/FixJ family response regulator
MIPPSRRDLRWTPDEDDLLRDMAQSGESAREISTRLNRSPSSIRERASRLKITLAKVRRLNFSVAPPET